MEINDIMEKVRKSAEDLQKRIKEAGNDVDALRTKVKDGSDSLDAKYDKVTGKYSYIVPIVTFVVGTIIGAIIGPSA